MRAFTIDPSIASEAERKLAELHQFCIDNGIAFVAGICTGLSKEEDGGGIEVNRKITSSYNGANREIAEFVAASKFISDDFETGEKFVHLHRHMLDQFGALIAEDNAKEACDVFIDTGDIDAARRAGGSLR